MTSPEVGLVADSRTEIGVDARPGQLTGCRDGGSSSSADGVCSAAAHGGSGGGGGGGGGGGRETGQLRQPLLARSSDSPSVRSDA
jgi:hypothetical protein